MGQIHDILDELRKWWIWARIGTGKPSGCKSALAENDDAGLIIHDDEAMRIDAIVARLKCVDASAFDALMIYLETESFREIARRLRCDRATAQKLFGLAMGWVRAKYGDSSP